MTSEQERNIIKNIPFLQYFSEEELTAFIKAGQKYQFDKNQIIFNEGDNGKTMYIILSGSIEIFKQNKQIAVRSSGDYFGEMAMIESKPRSASARASEAVSLFEIGENTFEYFLNSNTNIVRQFLQTISGRCRVDLDIIDTGYLEMYKSEERYRTIVESISDIVLQFDPQGKVTFANSAVMILGYSPSDLIGQHQNIIMKSNNPEIPIDDLLTKRIGPRATSNAEVLFLVNEDSPIHEFIKEMPFLVDAHGIWDVRNDIVMKKGSQKRFVGTLCVARDYTERKNSEDRLKQRKKELEELVRQRTLVLEESKKEAERANMAKTEFLSKISHELRTPLNAILGFSQLLESSPEYSAEDGEKFVHHIKQSATHLLSLINEILDLSRIESEKVEVDIKCLDIVPIVNDLVEILNPKARESQVTLNGIEEQPGPVLVEADETKLRQVVLNLLTNAIKYNQKNGEVNISIKNSFDGFVELAVADTGAGIAEQDHWKVFEPFQRLNWEYSSIEGTGIGLSISKKLMELMGGKIGFSSAPGRGSRFFIELPMSGRTRKI